MITVSSCLLHYPESFLFFAVRLWLAMQVKEIRLVCFYQSVIYAEK